MHPSTIIINIFSIHSNEPWEFEIISNPLDNSDNYLPMEFYSGKLSSEMLDQIPYRVAPTTDNKPYFNLLRKNISLLEIDSSKYVKIGLSNILLILINRFF